MLNFSNTATIYVSQKTGNHLNTGFLPKEDNLGNGPLKSIEQAFEKAYQLRCAGNFRPITVKILDDEYFIDNTMDFDVSKMCGKYKDNECICGVTVEPCGDRCKIVGGRRLEGFLNDEFNGKKCFSVHIPEVLNGEWAFTDLYVDGRRAKLTRYPKEGTLRCVDTEYNTGEQFTHSEWFIAKKEDLESIKDVESAIVSYYHYWIDEHSPVKSYDRESGKLTMEYKSRFLISNRYDETDGQITAANLEYYLENIAEAFSNPDEWYLDKKTGMLYYIPRNEEQTPDSITVYAPTVDKILNLCGTSELKIRNIYFRDIDFVCSRGDYVSVSADICENPEMDGKYASDCQSVANAYGAINFTYSKNCGMENCNFENLGVHGISIEQGCSDIEIKNCKISDIGAGGIRIFGGSAGCEATDETHHIKVNNCSITSCGRRYAAGCGILANHVHNSEFSDNEISYLDYSGISVGWVWGYGASNTYDNKISRNHIHHIGMGKLSDMGGIYMLGKQRGTLISENVIHDCLGSHYGGWGIYTDEGSSFMRIEKNIVYNISSDCYHQHYGSNNVVTNNIFAFGKRAVLACSIDELHASLLVEKNILITDNRPVFCTSKEEKGFNSALMSHHNLIYDVSGREPVMFNCRGRDFTFSEIQKLGMEEGSVVKNPKLSDDFEVLDNSPAIELGFKQIKKMRF